MHKALTCRAKPEDVEHERNLHLEEELINWILWTLLNIFFIGATLKGSGELARSDSLRSLHLFGNPIGDDGVCALAESPHVANLYRLDITQTDSGKRAERDLAKSPYLKQVRVEGFRE